MCVHGFGTKIKQGKMNSFYHGIGEKLVFPYGINDIRIYAPLSTSSSFCVATNFTNYNNGMVIEFTGEEAAYFSMVWLSDYPSESEYFFIQNRFSLKLCNIVEMETAYEYSRLLHNLYVIDKIMKNEHLNNFKQLNICSIKQIINHQLRLVCSEIDVFTAYGIKLMRTYFNYQHWIKLDYKLIKEKYLFLRNILFESEYEWINIQTLCRMFPNIQFITVINVHICERILRDIVDYIRDNKEHSKLQQIWISLNRKSKLHVNKLIAQYTQRFTLINVKIEIWTNNDFEKIKFTLGC
eukprot:266098_1